MEFTAEERRAAFEKRWQLGGVLFSKTFPDQMIDPAANEEARKFYEEKVRAVIDDPAVADLLIPNDHPIGTKRICTDSNYFQTFNRPNVTLDQCARHPDRIRRRHRDQHHRRALRPRHDRAGNGFRRDDRALAKIDIVGRDGATLRDDWAHGPRTYLGLGVDGFPNLFLISGPGAPAVLANMVLHAEAQVNWIADAIAYLDDHGYAAHRSHRGQRGRLGRRMRPARRGDAVHQGELVVHGRQCAGQSQEASCCSSAGFADLQRHLRRGRRRRLQGIRSDQDAVMTGLLGKVVVVTGAARGTGRVHCQRFADEGADVIALDVPGRGRRFTEYRNAKSRAAADGA